MVEFDEGTPFREQLAAMAGTGVLVSVHTSNLANAQFLPPGRAVVELLQRNWVWHNLDRSFQARARGLSCEQAALGIYELPQDLQTGVHDLQWRHQELRVADLPPRLTELLKH